MADAGNIYFRAFLKNLGEISSTVAGGGNSNLTKLGSYLMQEGLIQLPDYQAAIASCGDPTMTANKLCSAVMNMLKGNPDLYDNLLRVFTETEYYYPRQLLEKTVEELKSNGTQFYTGIQ